MASCITFLYVHAYANLIFIRDLKPANILLALKARNIRKEKNSQEADKKFDESEVFIHYEKGDYVAKISDMGLGKQVSIADCRFDVLFLI